MKQFLPLLCLFVICSFSNMLAQTKFNTQILKNALPTPDGYKERSKDRYEGLYNQKVGGEILDVVGVLWGDIKYYLDENEIIIIKTPETKKYKKIGITGVSFGLNKNYHLDILAEAGRKKEVPVKEVIGPNYIYAKNLGIFGYVGNPENVDCYIPVKVTNNSKNTTNTSQKINLVILSNTTLQTIKWSYSKQINNACIQFKEGVSPTPSSGNSFAARTPIVIPLDLSTDILPESEICVRLEVKSVGSQSWTTKSIKVLITPSIN